VATHDERLLSATVELNCNALVHLTRAVLPAMLESGGAIVNMSSLASRFPQPNLAVYAASKAFVDSFTRSLRDELLHSPVHVTCIRPGWVRTEFHARAGQSVDDVSDWLMPEDVVHEALVALEHNREFVSVPRDPALTRQARWRLRRWLRHHAPQRVLDAVRAVRHGARPRVQAT
jgi:short-subunit dehydrogenase